MSANVNNLLPVLQSAVENEDLDAVVTICDKMLKVSETPDAEALDCKVVALLQKSDFKAAIQTVESAVAQGAGTERLSFFKAYGMYRQTDDAALLGYIGTLDAKTGRNDEDVLGLEAQTLYRLHKAAEAAQIYKTLGVAEGEDAELMANYVATVVASGDTKTAVEHLTGEEPNFELEYNKACALVLAGRTKEAKTTLEQALELSATLLAADEASAEEIAQEQAPLKTQLAYVLQLLGDAAAAKALYEDVLAKKPKAIQVTTTAYNNLMVFKTKHAKLFERLNRSDKAINAPQGKLSVAQMKVVHFNRVLLFVAAKQFDKAAQALTAATPFLSTIPAQQFTLLKAAVKFGTDKTASKAILSDYVTAHPADSAVCRLSLAHVALSEKNTQQAIDHLLAAKELQHRPAWIATLVALYEEIGDKAGASSLLNDATEYWSSRDKSSAAFQALVERAAELKMQNNDVEGAIKLYIQLATEKKAANQPVQHQKVVAKLIVALTESNADPELAMKYAAQLPAMKELKGVNVDEIQLPNIERKRKAPTATVTDNKNNSNVETKTKKKRNRKVRYPKNFDPANPGALPDPERWLPAWQRTRDKNGKKIKKRNTKSGGAQGGALPGHEMSMETNMNEVKAAQPKPNKGKRNNKKKKKKGNRR